MSNKPEKVVTYKCPGCESSWRIPTQDASRCNIQLCKKCGRMVGLNGKNLIEAISYRNSKE